MIGLLIVVGVICAGCWLLWNSVSFLAWIWQVGAALIDDAKMNDYLRKRREDLEARRPQLEAEDRARKAERAREATLLTKRFVLHLVERGELDEAATLEATHRVLMRIQGIEERRELSKAIGLFEHYNLDAYAMEIDQLTEEEIQNQYAELLGPINNCLRDLIASRGSATALADIPEFAEIVSRAV